MRDTGCPAAKQLFCHIWNIGAADGLFQHVQGEPFALFHADLVETVFIIEMLSVIVIERTAQTQTLAALLAEDGYCVPQQPSPRLRNSEAM